MRSGGMNTSGNFGATVGKKKRGGPKGLAALRASREPMPGRLAAMPKPKRPKRRM